MFVNYTVGLAPDNKSWILVQLTVEESYCSVYTSYLNITSLKCPQGFVLYQVERGCHPLLQQASVWIGMGSDEEGLLTHMH